MREKALARQELGDPRKQALKRAFGLRACEEMRQMKLEKEVAGLKSCRAVVRRLGLNL